VDRLNALANELQARHGIDVEVLPADLGGADEVARVEARLAAEPAIDLLVNNAGFGTSGPFATLDPEREAEEVRVNCIAPLRLARAALPGMLPAAAAHQRLLAGQLPPGHSAPPTPPPKRS
jgi:short-subunit dehydrogenase